MFKTDYVWKIYVPEIVVGMIGEDLEKKMVKFYDGYTKYKAAGAWLGPKRRTIKEEVWVYEIVVPHHVGDIPKCIEDIINYIIWETNEDTVLYTKSPIQIFTRERIK